MGEAEKIIAYGHEDHRLFNERLAQRQGQAQANDVVAWPWLSNEAVLRLPPAKRDFDMSRDPLLAAQLRDLERAEAQRRGGQSGRASEMVRRDRPRPAPRPPWDAGRSVDAARFNDRWLAEQRSAAMATARPQSRAEVPFPSRTPSDWSPQR